MTFSSDQRQQLELGTAGMWMVVVLVISVVVPVVPSRSGDELGSIEPGHTLDTWTRQILIRRPSPHHSLDATSERDRLQDFSGVKVKRQFRMQTQCFTDTDCIPGLECCVPTIGNVMECRPLQGVREICHPRSRPAPHTSRRSFPLCPCVAELQCSKSTWRCERPGLLLDGMLL